ncbi:41939_t:CDS:2 [Gigaspora margarita]|uniref:41939_t:CDS:1 n=1 Tax=Gigaspora margarita TaxID=4874 RepID=A0ABN7VMM6_GIGMA|nr:41939_t:CDS:2 [Gigaspora margarita]
MAHPVASCDLTFMGLFHQIKALTEVDIMIYESCTSKNNFDQKFAGKFACGNLLTTSIPAINKMLTQTVSE